MQSLNIILEGDGAWPDLAGTLETGEAIHVKNIVGACLLDGGRQSGLPSVALRIELPDGKVVIAETSARLFCSAAKAFMARVPNLFD